jgi:CDP-Glycerol:Poly(glycerophosphate) glycerophosphotransferase
LVAKTTTVLVVMKDPGGSQNMMPLCQEMKSRGVRVTYVASGKAIDICKAAGIVPMVFESASAAEQYFDQQPVPDLYITTMCTGGGVGTSLVEFFRKRGVKTIALQDFWGARLQDAYKDSRFRPEVIVVNDVVGEQLVHKAWGKPSWWHAPRTKVVVSGYPSLDRFAGYDPEKRVRAQVRRELGIPHDAAVCTFPGQVAMTGTVFLEVAQALCDVCASSRSVITVMPRKHPRMDEAPLEVATWNQALELLRSSSQIQLVEDSSKISMQDVLQASDLVAGAFSTALIEAAVLRKQVIAFLFPETGWKQYQEELGHLMDEFPLVALGCAARARSPVSARELVTQALRGQLNLRHSQERYFTLDGKNAKRLASTLLSV